MPQVRHAIINPASNHGRTGRRWPALRERVRALGIHVHEHFTTAQGHATEIARQLAADAAREMIVIGGDGTLNEVVNGLYTGPSSLGDTILSVIPCGTGQDFARNIGIRSTTHAIGLLTEDSIRSLDMGKVRFCDGDRAAERIFLNVADVGLGAETAARINRSSKRLGGFLTYFVGATRSIMAFQGRPARVIIDGQVVHDGRIAMVVLANGRYHAGGMLMAPDASLIDGQLDVLILLDVPKRTLLTSILPRVYRGRHIGHPAVRAFRGREIIIQSPDRLLVEMDGEQPGTTELHATVLPKAIQVRAPACQSTLPNSSSTGPV